MGDVTLSSFLGMTPQTVLDKVKQVDGPDSGLDSDTIDGKHASDFAAATAGASVATGYWKSNAAQYGVNAPTVTGSLVIKTSIPSGSSNMVRVVVRGYDYSANGTWVVECGGYFYSTGPTLINHSVQIYGAPPSSEVRHAISPDGFKCIIIGVDTTVWKYPRFNVDAMVGYSGSASLADGWTASIESNTTTYTQKVLFAANQPIANITGLQAALDDKFSKSTANTITQSTVIAGELKIDSGGYVSFSGTSYMDLNNKNIVGVNRLMFADPGDDEGIGWAGGNGWRIWEGPNTLGNGSGNLQIVTNYDVTPTRHSTFLTDGSFEVTAGPIRVGSNVVWHAGNFTPTLSGLTNVNIASPVDGHVLTYDSATSKWVNRVPPAGGGGGGSGTVTSVGLSMPTGFSVTNTPVTASGTLTVSFAAGYQVYTTTEANKLSGIATGATVGATWGSNLSSVPTAITNFGNLSNAAGLLRNNGSGGLSWDSSTYITSSGSISGNAGTATKLATSRNLTIGSTAKAFDGSGNVSWTLAEIGAVAAGANVAFGALGGSRIYSGWDSGTTGSISCSNWFRSSGQTGIYFSDYVGGWYMTDSTYVRSYNNKAVAASDFVISSDSRLKVAVTPFVYRGRLTPVCFHWKHSGLADFGFIADQVQALYPEAVGEIDGDPALGLPEKILQLSYQKLTAVLAFQVNRLEDENAVLRRDVDDLKEQLQLLLSRFPTP